MAVMHVRCDAATVHLSGVLDVRSVAVVRDALEATFDTAAGDVVLDVTGLDGVDAAGLGVLVATHRKAHRGGRRLVLRGARAPFLRTLAVTRLHRVLHVERLVPA